MVKKDTYPHLPCGTMLHLFSSSFAPEQWYVKALKMLNVYANAFRMKQLHNPAFFRGNKASSKTFVGLHLLSQFYLTARDGHTSTSAVHWQLGRWGRVNGKGRVGESQLRKSDSTYAVKSTGCLIPTWLDMRQIQEKGLMANVQEKKKLMEETSVTTEKPR